MGTFELKSVGRLKFNRIFPQEMHYRYMTFVYFVHLDEHPVVNSGKLSPGSIVQVRDIETGESLGVDQKGQLCFQSQLACPGYFNNPNVKL